VECNTENGIICDGLYHYRTHEINGRIVRIDDKDFTTCPYNIFYQMDMEERNKLRKYYRTLDEEFFIFDENKTFKTFNLAFNEIEKECAQIQDFIYSDLRILLLVGKTGRGKTHLCHAILNHCQFKRKKAKMIEAPKLYEIFKNMSGIDYDEIYDDVLKLINNCDVIIVDDLGTETQTEREVFNKGFKEILDHHKGKIIITANLSRQDMVKIYGEKIFSRLHEKAKWILLKGKDRDYRIQKDNFKEA